MLVDGLGAAGDRVTTAIRTASRTTGASFDYLLNTAMRESSLDPAARARGSSARGLYQFIEATWLEMVKEEGPKFGLGRHAQAIGRGARGQYVVRDPAARAEILRLREDPEVSALMAGALASRNGAALGHVLGRKPTAGELYLAHFLGAGGARRLISLARHDPHVSAAAAFPEAARANPSVFHHKNGRPRSALEVYAAITARHDSRPIRPAPPTQPTAVAALRPAIQAAVEPARPNPPAPRETYAHPVSPGRSAFAAAEGPAFQALFRDGRLTQAALSSAVRELWGAPEAPPPAPAGRGEAGKDAAAGAPDPFSPIHPHARPGG